MICLLRVGFDGAEEPDEALLTPVADRLGTYRIERRDEERLGTRPGRDGSDVSSG